MICNPLLQMKNEQERLRERFPYASASFLKRNLALTQKNVCLLSPEQSQALLAVPPGDGERSGMKIRDTTDQAKLNKTERAYWEHLKQSQLLDSRISWVGVQNITLKLADDCRLTCDFFVILDGQLIAIDTKGSFVREDSKIKLKVAARLFPWIKFFIVRRSNYGWNEEEVKP